MLCLPELLTSNTFHKILFLELPVNNARLTLTNVNQVHASTTALVTKLKLSIHTNASALIIMKETIAKPKEKVRHVENFTIVYLGQLPQCKGVNQNLRKNKSFCQPPIGSELF